MCATKTRTRTAKASLTIPAPTRFKFLNRKRDDPSLLSKVDPMSPSPSSSTNTVNYLQSKAAEWKMKLTGGSTGFPPFFGSNGVTNSCAAQLKAELTKDDEWEEVEEVDSDVIEEDFDDKEDGPVCSAVFKLPECSGKFGKTGRPLSNQQNGAFLNESNTAGSEGHHRSLLDDYERVCTIGTGTFGRVILVRDRELGKYFALKVMSISDVIHMKQVEHVHSEKKVLEKLNHTFIINLYAAQHDNRCLYMLFDYAPGGELFSYLRSSGSFPNSTCRFYTAEIVCALDYLHKKNIVYRDLKPENLLLDKYGHLKLTDFGFAKELFDRQVRTWTLCGTPEYLAPEVIEGKGHNKAVDWWALGILIYEMQAGYPPFFGDNALKIYEKILEARVKFPKKFDLVAKDLVKKLLVPDRIHRLGSLKNGADDLKNHKWFKHINWEEVVERKLHPPITPKLYAEGDTGNFDEYDEESIDDIPIADQSDLDLFKGW